MSSNPAEEQFLKDLFEIFGDRVSKFNPELYEHLKFVWARGREFERSQTPEPIPMVFPAIRPPAPGSVVASHMESTNYAPVYMDEQTGKLVAVNKWDPSRGTMRIEHRQVLQGEGSYWSTPSGFGPPSYHPVEVYVNGELADPSIYTLTTGGSCPIDPTTSMTTGTLFHVFYPPETCVELRWCELKDTYVV